MYPRMEFHRYMLSRRMTVSPSYYSLTPHCAYCRVRAVALVQAQRLHGDVVDVQVLHAVERREREGDHTLELRVVLWIRPARERHLVLVATHPLDFAVAKTAPALLAVSLQLKVVVVVSTRHR